MSDTAPSTTTNTITNTDTTNTTVSNSTEINIKSSDNIVNLVDDKETMSTKTEQEGVPMTTPVSTTPPPTTTSNVDEKEKNEMVMESKIEIIENKVIPPAPQSKPNADQEKTEVKYDSEKKTEEYDPSSPMIDSKNDEKPTSSATLTPTDNDDDEEDDGEYDENLILDETDDNSHGVSEINGFYDINDALMDDNNRMFNIGEMIEREKNKIEESLNPKNSPHSSPTTSSSRKRKIITAPSISLLSFINIIQDIYREIRCDDGKIIFKRNIRSYVDDNIDPEAKRFLYNNPTTLNLSNITTLLPSSNGATTTTTTPPTTTTTTGSNSNNDSKIPYELRQRIYNSIIVNVLGFLEGNGMICQFPKETLKFFLATYQNFITPNDFINTNAVVKTERRSKNNTPLSNGAILQEYVKGFDIFISSMPRSDHNDIRALKMIVENKISISHNIYEIINNINFTPPNYTVDTKAEIRSNYSQIAISNAKHIYVLITADILMCYDGNQFVTPQTNIEREFTSLVRQSPMLKSNGRDYVLLEVIFATKARIVDILQCSINKKTDLPAKYTDRLTFVSKVLPSVTLVNITPQTGTNSMDLSYIQKPNEGFEPAYIYHKSHLVAAAVGIIDKTVALAFLENDNNTLNVKSKVSISGPITCCISAMPLVKDDHRKGNGENTIGPEAEPKILHHSRRYNLSGDYNDVQLFKRVITVELRDGNRLGSLSTAPISKINEYKPVVARRETTILMRDIEARLDLGDNEFLTTLLMNITNTAMPLNQTQRDMMKRWLEPNINVSFDDYK